MKELTYEEFCDIPLDYVTGISFETGAHRMYRNDVHGIQKEVITKRNPRTYQWGKGKVFLYLDGDPRVFANSAELYVAYMEKVCGIRLDSESV